MKNELRPGETIDLLIPDVLVNYGSGENGNLSVKLADETWLFIPAAMARVTRRVPADGVPKPGDVWRDQFGGVWFARDGGVFVSQEDRPYCSWQGVNEDCGPIELLYRPGDDFTAPAPGEAVVGDMAVEPATALGPADEPEHALESGWTGPAGQCGASCTCGVTYDNFATLGEATALIDSHIDEAGRDRDPAVDFEPVVEQDPARLDDLSVAATGADELAPIRICSIWPHAGHGNCPGVYDGVLRDAFGRELSVKPDADGYLIAPYTAEELT